MDAIAKSFIELYNTLLGTNKRKREHVNNTLVRQGPVVTETQSRLLEEEFTEKKVTTTFWAINGENHQVLMVMEASFSKIVGKWWEKM